MSLHLSPTLHPRVALLRTLFSCLTHDLKSMPNLPRARFHKMSRATFDSKTFTSATRRALASVCFVVSAFLWSLANMSLLLEPVDVARVQREPVYPLIQPSSCLLIFPSIQLVERFYDPLSGRIFLDGQPISELNVREYRKHLSLVSQEPVSIHHLILIFCLMSSIRHSTQALFVSTSFLERLNRLQK